jgi:hypothetical protein
MGLCVRVTSLSLLLLLTVAGAPSGPKERAREHFAAGTTHYNLREYQEALDEFKAAYRLYRDPVFLFNIAQCHRFLKQPEEAASFYRAYRRDAPTAVRLAEVERLIVDMEHELTALRTAAAEQRQAQPPPEPKPTPRVDLTLTAPPPARVEKPVYKKGWFWAVMTISVAAVAAGVTVGVIYGAPQYPAPSLGKVAGP